MTPEWYYSSKQYLDWLANLKEGDKAICHVIYGQGYWKNGRTRGTVIEINSFYISCQADNKSSNLDYCTKSGTAYNSEGLIGRLEPLDMPSDLDLTCCHLVFGDHVHDLLQ